MKKVFTLSSLIVFIVLCSISLISDKDKISTVFNKEDEYYYNIYLIDVSNEDVNTKNVLEYFEDIKILNIYPNINPIYEKFINIKEYEFNSILSSKKNISNFILLYSDTLKQNGLGSEIDSFNINGIKLDKIRVYASVGQIENLINVNPNFIIEETSDTY